MVEPVTYTPLTAILFLAAALTEIGGRYLVWLWIREGKKSALGMLGGIVLFIYGIIMTLQPSHFGRVYAAYGGIFIITSMIWGKIIDKRRPDRLEVIGSLIAVLGAVIIFYAPR